VSEAQPPVGQIDDLTTAVYAELRRIAHRQRRHHGFHDTLATTALVNEAYLRLKNSGRLEAVDRTHFLALSARAMRHILVDYARQFFAAKRGGGVRADTFEEGALAGEDHAERTLVLNDALERLSAISERLVKVVEYRFFGGMTEKEIGEMLGVTERTVRSEWQRAKIWLGRQLAPGARAGNE